MTTALDIVTKALQEINAVGQGEQPDTEDANYALSLLNDLMDEWSARKCFVYAMSYPVYTLVPGLLPHTIGPMGQLTQSSLTNNLATYIQQNSYSNGDSVTVLNSTNGLNTTGRVQLATATKFSIAYIHADVAPAVDSGNSILSGTVPPTFATSGNRPQKIVAASLVLNNSTPNVDIPMNIRDDKWWMANRVKPLQSNVPTDLYYNPAQPNGELYFWPVPSTTYLARLEIWGALSQFPTLNTQFSFPPGYAKAIRLDLAFDLVGPFQGSWSQNQNQARLRALKAVQSNNIKSPRGTTLDGGMPGTGGGGFNWESALPETR